MKIGEVLSLTTQYLHKHGVDSPRLSAEWLLADLLAVKRLDLYLRFDQSLPEELLETLRTLVRRRARGEPLQYIQGYALFRGQRFTVTPATFIPRPETEILLEEILPFLDPQGPPILDVGTGCGVLAICLAQMFPQLTIFGCDKSDAALAVAKENAQGLGNVTFLESDLLDGAPQIFYQAIVANLPYIPTAWIPKLPKEIQWEPVLALDGGPDGMRYIRGLAEQARGRCRWLALEIGDGQAEPIQTSLQKLGYHVTKLVEDLRGIPRVLIAQSCA
ncbi:peptide chain release factor N(5)-glutamine methyltransferase [Candidatus Methylacidithermus pantelleriae]|uniref:Release factor glutamine methyltransferase n=1 Tax=Candidatus Methylacidithermus pantelleriae TaxID=2744239 RepID=A0A8J2BHT0_9BACT|nr:peptide chain release factor N(5)-glutamine methyltransferase [Candidatus Methylacidithermus pantelleriae]CAF0691345.1 Release factor glutamine methyltransferase [Candidatus Methylacidithermus pantelleriae]